ncbi:hypothetical protein VAH18_003490 [Providencia rettgeri]|nr:hypothetical protein [Providencia rettgeri]
METSIYWLCLIVIVPVFIVGCQFYIANRNEGKKYIENGERYSTLEIFKSIERHGKVIYYLGDEKNQIEVSKVDYEYAIKVYQESIRKK